VLRGRQSFLLSRKKWKSSMPVVSSFMHFFAKPLLYTTLGMVSVLFTGLLSSAM
jgi:hypothetical protein